jgi:peptidoglycan/xylan/chitin deacetylase (PgdA/CDA1 family)
MDDIQDYWVQAGQLAAMDLFLSKHLPLSLGLIMHDVGNDSRIVDKVRGGSQSGLFELALHGWDHVDYTKLGERVQESTLVQANQKMDRIFGRTSEIFIPPFNKFNNSTLKAMSDLGLRILSSSAYEEYLFDQNRSLFMPDIKNNDNNDNENNQGIYHLAEIASFTDYEASGNLTKVPIENILSDAIHSIDKYGYAVILFHPQDLMKIDENGKFTSILDKNQVKELSHLIDSLLSRDIAIISFSKVIEDEGCCDQDNIGLYY